ncbi:hypothetical protein SLEP1_g34300 [Rubroshorea leprosula]|uniref:Uncharacterized protein n=1 Tax=Rubroshorea leprosula TaxID=152421 RepID=A0AAV5KJM1_9ROSI|nr:hypothetical protein SLEP1_g34300 [Rubroshorea leprosula]
MAEIWAMVVIVREVEFVKEAIESRREKCAKDYFLCSDTLKSPLAAPALHAAPAPLLPALAPGLALHFPLCTPGLCAPDPALCASARAQPVPLLPVLGPDRLHSVPRSPAIIPPTHRQSCPCTPPTPPAAAPNQPLPPTPLYCCIEPAPPTLYAPIPCPCLLHTTTIQKK